MALHAQPGSGAQREGAPLAPPGGRLLDVAALLLRTGPLLILAISCVVMAMLSPVFLRIENLTNLTTATAFIAIVAAGQFVVILIRGLDVSVGAVLAFGVVLGGTLGGMTNPVALIGGALLGGLLVGLINGSIVVKGRIAQPIIVTVATLGVVRGLALLLADGQVKVGVPDAVLWLGGGFAGPLPVPVIVAVTLAAVLWVATRLTRWGRWLYAVGGSPEAAARLGIPTSAVTVSAYVLCSVLAAFAGVLVAGRTSAIDPTAGALTELDAITAVVIGGASLSGGRGSVVNVMIGALILGVIRNGLNLLAVSSFYQQILIGVLVLIALEIDVLRRVVDQRLKVRHTLALES